MIDYPPAVYSAQVATDSASKWAGVGRASGRGKNIIPEVAHFSQEMSGAHLIISSPSFRFHHLVSSFYSGNWAAIPVMWATAWRPRAQAPTDPAPCRELRSHSCSSPAALRRMYDQ